MVSMLFLIETIQRNQFRWNYLKNKKLFLDFSVDFWNVVCILNLSKKRMTLIAKIFAKLRTPDNMVRSISKSPVSRDPSETNMVNDKNIFEISIAAPLPYLLITVKEVDLQKLLATDMQNLKTFS